MKCPKHCQIEMIIRAYTRARTGIMMDCPFRTQSAQTGKYKAARDCPIRKERILRKQVAEFRSKMVRYEGIGYGLRLSDAIRRQAVKAVDGKEK